MFVGFAGVFAFAGFEHVDLAASGWECAQGSAHAKEDEFCDVAEVEADAAAVGAAVFASFGPDEVGDVAESPGFHDGESVGE